jgi:hypothetical protein
VWNLPPETSATLAGHRCAAGGALGAAPCVCRNLEDPADAKELSPPAAGLKRFELRLGRTTDPTWVEIDGVGVVSKSLESADVGCFYVDLPGGQHRITYRTTLAQRVDASDAPINPGLTSRFQVYEYNPAGPWWYASFVHLCGVQGACTPEDMRRWQQEQRSLPGGVRDVCGSSRVEQVRWSGRAPATGDPYDTLQVSALLRVMPEAPQGPPRDRSCSAR